MEKFCKNIISTIGIGLCALVFILNIFSITTVKYNELLTIKVCDVIELFTAVIIAITIIIISKNINDNLSKKQKIILWASLIIIYFVFQVFWINVRDLAPTYDQDHVFKVAEHIYENKLDKLGSWYKKYLGNYPQQLSLAYFWAFLFEIFNSSNVLIIQYINAVANTLTLIGLALISKQLGKKYEININKTILISFLFITLPLLSTFVYGDIISITLCVYSVYFIMKYREKEKILFALIASVLTALAYILRMNNLIYIIAICIYLFLDILSSNKSKILLKILILFTFIFISLMPGEFIKLNLKQKCNIGEDLKFPVIGYLYMGIEDDGYRGEGWYDNGIANIGLKNGKKSIDTYKMLIDNRLKDFKNEPFDIIKFYVKKFSSMWTENTYSAIIFNHSFYSAKKLENYEIERDEMKITKIDEVLLKNENKIALLQKGIILFIFSSTMLILIKNRKSISNEVLLLVLIFIGGFIFHMFWEAKSRYIIMYIVMLMPIASIELPFYLIKIRSKIEKENEIID